MCCERTRFDAEKSEYNREDIWKFGQVSAQGFLGILSTGTTCGSNLETAQEPEVNGRFNIRSKELRAFNLRRHWFA